MLKEFDALFDIFNFLFSHPVEFFQAAVVYHSLEVVKIINFKFLMHQVDGFAAQARNLEKLEQWLGHFLHNLFISGNLTGLEILFDLFSHALADAGNF